MEPDCDVEKLKIQSSCKGNWSYKIAVSKRSRHNIQNKNSFENNLKINKDREKYPLGGQKLELAAKMAQDASKSDF